MQSQARPRRGRWSRAFPWVLLGLVVLIFYWVEAAVRKTPWLFTDELEWSQLSRAIATTGHAARRGEPHSFESLYSFLIAPAWWIHSTADAYAAIKDLNAVVMCLAAVPTYLLARMLLVRRPAVVVALLSIAIPAMSYASSIVPEPLAYLWFTLAAWLAVRALAAPGWKTGAAGSRARGRRNLRPARVRRAAGLARARRCGCVGHRPGRVDVAAGADRRRGASWSSRFSSTSSSSRSFRAGRSTSTSTTRRSPRAASPPGRSRSGSGCCRSSAGSPRSGCPSGSPSRPTVPSRSTSARRSSRSCIYTAAKAAYLFSEPRADDRGAESLLPLAAPADRHRARVRCPQAQLAARCALRRCSR